MIPALCPEMPPQQKRALGYGSKVPLIYTSVALKNWRAFEKLGIQSVSCPGMYHNSMSLDSVVDIGDYTSPKSPDEPILVHMLRTPCSPGMSARDQQRMGRFELFGTSFETFERNIRDQMARVLGDGGFDPTRDIAAITVNRWSHGYAYEYTPPLGSRLGARSATLRNSAQALWPDRSRQLGCGGRSVHRPGNRSRVSSGDGTRGARAREGLKPRQSSVTI